MSRRRVGSRVAAIRETFQGVGMLIAYGRDGRVVRFSGAEREKFVAYRRACQGAG